MRRITQLTLIEIIEAAESVKKKYLQTCRIVTGLAEDLQPSAIREAILQLTSNAEFDIYKEAILFAAELGRIEATQARNNYLRRRREAIAGDYVMTDDDLDGFPASLPSDQFVDDDEPESPGESK